MPGAPICPSRPSVPFSPALHVLQANCEGPSTGACPHTTHSAAFGQYTAWTRDLSMGDSLEMLYEPQPCLLGHARSPPALLMGSISPTPRRKAKLAPQCLAVKIQDFTKFGKDFEPCARYTRGHRNKVQTCLSREERDTEGSFRNGGLFPNQSQLGALRPRTAGGQGSLREGSRVGSERG